MIGLGQIWHKWKWRYVKEEKKRQFQKKYDELVSAGFLDETPKELRINVGKRRIQRKFIHNNGKLEPFPIDDKKLPYGFLAEVTKLEWPINNGVQ